MPQNIRIRLNVGGAVLHTSLYTIMEGARRGGAVFQCLCAQILGPNAPTKTEAFRPWEHRIVSARAEQYKVEHFIDADPTPFPYWLDYLRTGDDPVVPVHLRAKFIRETERAGFADLASSLREHPGSDRVELEVGGEVFVSTYETLEKHGGYLGTLLHSSIINSDRIFIDRDPVPFRHILSWMRTGHFAHSELPYRKVMTVMIREVIFYDLPQLMGACIRVIAEQGGIMAVLEVLSAHKSCVCVQEEGRTALNNLAQESDITAIIEALSAHTSNEICREWGCEALAVLAENAENTAEIAQQGGIEAVLEAVSAHTGNANVQQWGCQALFHLAENDANKIKIAQQGGIKMVLKALSAHKTSTVVQDWGRKVLNIFAQQSGIKAVLEALLAHKSNAKVVQWGCEVLWNLTVHNHDNRVKIAEEGGIKALLEAMSAHTSNADVQHYGCGALFILALNDSNQVKIAKEGGIKALLEAMSAHTSNANVQHHGCWALLNLAMNDNNQVKIAEEGGIKAVLEAMSAHTSNANVQHQGCGALLNIGSSMRENQKLIKDAGGEGAVKRAMEASNATSDTKKNGQALLDRLSGV